MSEIGATYRLQLHPGFKFDDAAAVCGYLKALGITHVYPLPEVGRALALYARSNAIIGGKTRVAGLTLKATDTELSLGSGPLVEGPAISLLLVASGRKSALDELSGPGVELLRSRS